MYSDARLESGVSADDQQVIVDKHNEYRLLIAQGKVSGQPKAAYMKRLMWDDHLAQEAQKIADILKLQHKNVSDGRWLFVGQNLYISMSTVKTYGANWSEAITSWFNEVNDFKYGSNSCSSGHYTQLIWADTTHVGAGYTFFSTNDRFQYRKLYVCNYGPGGNIRGQNPYKINTGPTLTDLS